MTSVPTTTKPRRRRRWLRILLSGAVVACVAAAVLPWWLPAVAVRVGAAYGVSIGDWVSRGWSGTEYRDIVYARDGVRVVIGAARVPLFGVHPRSDVSGAPVIVVTDVVVTIAPSKPPHDAVAPGMGRIARSVERVWTGLQKWLPATRLERLSLDAGGKHFEATALEWDGRAIKAAVRVPWDGFDGVVSMAALSPGRWRVVAQAPARAASVDLAFGVSPDGGAEAAGDVAWEENAAKVRAAFGPVGLLPSSASITADAASIPAADLGLDGYGPLTGSARLEWLRDAYAVEIAAKADPVAGAAWPAVAVDVRASGDFEGIKVDAIDIHLPGVRVGLSPPLEWSFAGGMPLAPAEFTVDMDLGAVSAIPAQGRVTGSLRVRPTSEGLPEVGFALAGSALAWRGVEGARLNVAGVWRDPELVLESALLDLGGDLKSEAAATIDLRARVVRSATMRAKIPQALLRALKPDSVPCERIELEASLEGPFAALAHRGALKFSALEWASERRIGGELSWTGVGRNAAVEGQLALTAGGTMPFACSAESGDDGVLRAGINRLQWIDDRGEWWRLEAPVRAEYVAGTGELQVSPWKIVGDGVEATGEARIRWPVAGRVSLTIAGLHGERFGGVLPEAIRGGSIERLNIQADWDNSPVVINGGIRAIYAPVPDTSFAVEGEFITRDAGLAFGSLEVLGASGPVLRGTGHVPLELAGTAEGFHAKLARDGAISLDLASEPNPVFWKSIADLTGWTIDEPRLACRFNGSIAAPRGEVEFSAATLRPPAIKLANGGQLPELTGLLVKLVADDQGVSISESMIAIDYRWITLTGHAPWEVWTRWRESHVVDWRKARFELASNPLPIAIASRVFPTELAPVGEVSIKIAHEPGPALSGRIWLHGAALRPIGQFGAVRDVQCELDFEKYRMTLAGLEGSLSGQAVKITGFADIEDLDHPEYELHVVSSRVPLVRRPGLIVRAEMDLVLKQDRTGPAGVSGRVDFGPSLFSADLLSLIPSGVETAKSRPPYFSVEDEPFAHWTLDVALHGDGFLRVTTPFYKDLISADLTLMGTLGDPRVVGWVWGAGGTVSFPFGGIAVEQVLITLTRESPFDPTLVVSGSGRVLGYDVRMEASGPVSDPRLLFTSDPPLTSQQIFLMLSSGAVPGESNSIATTDRARRMAFFLGRNLASGLGLNSTGGGDSRLVIRSGEDFTRDGGETVYVQYDLDGRWSIVGEYDRFDAYNGGLKFRIINR